LEESNGRGYVGQQDADEREILKQNVGHLLEKFGVKMNKSSE
jgi:hypothetical protein